MVLVTDLILLFSFQGTKYEKNMKNCVEKSTSRKSGDNSEEVTPVPISNTEVKLLSADDTWWEAAWESRTLPVFIKAPWSSGQDTALSRR